MRDIRDQETALERLGRPDGPSSERPASAAVGVAGEPLVSGMVG